MDKEKEEELINNDHLEQPRKTSCTGTSSTKDFLIDDQIHQLHQTLQKNGVYHLLSRIEQQHQQQETATNDQIQEKSFSYPTRTHTEHTTTSTSNHEQISEKTDRVLCSSSSTTHDVNQNYTNICTINDMNEVLKQQQHQKNESKMDSSIIDEVNNAKEMSFEKYLANDHTNDHTNNDNPHPNHNYKNDNEIDNYYDDSNNNDDDESTVSSIEVGCHSSRRIVINC